ncbi:dTDP-4-amino-4,6-dideoxy-D-galactose acyltransferase [Testudinibacter sp. P80/BLE/0925]|uniref:dTDP-4-amino-4,6-dideoxy-D-galactose acyltransferase n=1 Tax=Testudinibacter sp. TW-1 TaxID=3417757 RepID=UPI003D366A9D
MESTHFKLTRNDWESDFFAMEIGRLQFTGGENAAPHTVQGNESAVFAPFELVQCKIHADQAERIHRLQQLGFQFVEGELDFCLPLSETKSARNELQTANDRDLDELENLFGDAFQLSRFRQPWFSAQQNRTFYRTWIGKAVSAQFDDVCLVQRGADGSIQGAVSVRSVDTENARVGLLAVAENARGQGVAKKLVQSAVDWSAQRQRQQLWIATQSGNQAAIKLYQQSGKIAQVAYWFYR